MKFVKRFLIYLIIFFFNFINVNSYENKILIKINNDIITSIDLYNESNYLLALNTNLKELEKNEIYEIAKKSLIKDRIKAIELLKHNKSFQSDEKYISELVKSIYKNLNLNNFENFIDYLNQFNVSYEYLKNKLSIQLEWNNLIATKFINNVVIDVEKIKNDIQKNMSKNSKEYLLSEIVFEIPSNKTYEEKIKTIESDIEKEGFINAALIHSISNSASNNNGKIGWLNENSINKNIKEILNNLKIGNHTKPITVPGGFLILKIEDIRIVENQNYDLDKKINEIINIKRNEQLNSYSNIYFNKVKKDLKIYEN